jgi:hypothetical protein
MNEMVQFFARRGYWVLMGAVPGPVSVFASTSEFDAGRGSGAGRLSLPDAIALAVITFLTSSGLAK